MFNSSKAKENIAEAKTEDKIGQDFITHNMPAPHLFSGQTFSNGTKTKTDKAITVSGAESHHKVGILIIAGGLILIGVLFYFGYAYFIKPMLTPKEIAPVTDVVKETPATTTPQVVENILPTESVATDTPIISTSTSETASSSETVFPEEAQVVTSTVAVSTVDSDADGLTDAEEKIIGTDPNKADTDGDGYLDIAELKSGYDPLVPGGKVTDNSKMLSYKLDTKATVIYPASWEITRSDINSTVIFDDASDAGKAFIQVTYKDNPSKIKPNVWFNQEFSGLNPGETVSGETWQGIYSQDGLAVYVFNKDFSKIYSFSCSPLTSDNTVVSLFHLMIKTLTIK